MAWANVTNVELGDSIRVTLADGTVHTHRRAEHGWRVDMSGAAQRTIELGGRVSTPALVDSPVESPGRRPAIALRPRAPHTIVLAEPHYRRSEPSWREAGSPTAAITLEASGGTLRLTIVVPRSDRMFSPSDAVNRYDNEPADINGDGVQLHVRSAVDLGAWILVPEAGSNGVRVRAIGAPSSIAAPRASWRTSSAGYQLDIELSPVPQALDVIVNEMPTGRARRRGQLVMSGAAGEFVYLRGDRHEATRLMLLEIVDE
jgi:hypothetical protein